MKDTQRHDINEIVIANPAIIRFFVVSTIFVSALTALVFSFFKGYERVGAILVVVSFLCVSLVTAILIGMCRKGKYWVIFAQFPLVFFVTLPTTLGAYDFVIRMGAAFLQTALFMLHQGEVLRGRRI